MAAAYLQKLRLFSRDVRLYLITAALFGFTVCQGIYPVLLNLYLLRLGFGGVRRPDQRRLSAARHALLPAGALGARWGVRRMMIAGLSLTMVGRALLPVTELMPSALLAGS
jgi:MFS family permease